jgi:hypothetical protein
MLALILLAPPGPVAETPRPARCELSLTVRGKLTVQVGGDKPEGLPLSATARHTFVEFTDRPGRLVRDYSVATSTSQVAGERAVRELPADRRRIVAQQTATGLVHYSPAGPLARDELELVAEHLSPAAVAALLPGAPVAVGGTWRPPADAVRVACHLDGLTACEVVGSLTAENAFALSGTVSGVENGAAVRINLTAAGTLDPNTRLVTKLRWEQADDRGQGPASPASEVTAVAEWLRTPADRPATADLPAGDSIPTALTDLRFADPKGRFTLTHSRDWFAVGQTADHVVLRLIDGGRFVAQATLSPWRATGPTPADEFRAAVRKQPGWQAEAELAAGELAGGLYRVAARGTLDGRPVIQTAYLVGGRLAVSVLAEAATAGAVAGRDERLARGVSLRP